MGKTRSETLSVLKKHFSFEPSLAQLNAQMAVWGLQTYKKVGCLEAKEFYKIRKYTSSRVYVGDYSRVSPPPHVEFVRSSDARLKAILKGYMQQVGADATRFISLLWKSISCSDSVESFLTEHRSSPVSDWMLKIFGQCEEFGDFLLAGRSLHDAFDTYSCFIYIKMIGMDRIWHFMKEKMLIGLVVKCCRSAESDEQKKLVFELLEFCLLKQSITGVLTDAVSGSLRQYYTEKSPSQNFHVEPRIWDTKDKFLKLKNGILPMFMVTYISMSPSWVVTKHSEIYLPIQHAIYAQLWHLHNDFPYNTEALAPNLQRCESLATAAHILAQDMLERSSGYSLGSTEASGSISIREKLLRLFDSDMCNVAILDKHSPTTKSQEVSFLNSLQARYQDDSHIHAQCTQWLQEQVFASVHSCPSLSIIRNLPLGVVHKDKVKDSAAPLTNETVAVHIDMVCSSHNDGSQPSFSGEPWTKTTKSIYLRSSSTRSSMRSMLSMASRIRSNALGSTLSRTSQRSSYSMAMSISSNFEFDRVTGMGSVTLAEHSMDIMETEEHLTREEAMDVDIYSR